MAPDRALPARAVLLGAGAAVLGVAAHGEAGGAVAATPTALAVGVAVVVATALLGARPRTPVQLAVVLAAGQLALHLALPPGAHDHHGMHAAPAPHGPGMLVAHLAAAVLVAGGIAHADRALARAARRRVGLVVTTWTQLLAGPPPTPRQPLPMPPTRPVHVARRRRTAVTLHPRRGPPSPRPTATTPRHGRTPSCPDRGHRPPAHAVEARSPRW